MADKIKASPEGSGTQLPWLGSSSSNCPDLSVLQLPGLERIEGADLIGLL